MTESGIAADVRNNESNEVWINIHDGICFAGITNLRSVAALQRKHGITNLRN